MLKCSIFRTSLLNIEQGSFLSQMTPSQKVCKYILPLHTLSKLYDVPVSYAPPPILRLCIALFVVAEGWLLLDIG